jgi:chromosomal replication initiation ATPase DnaA
VGVISSDEVIELVRLHYGVLKGYHAGTRRTALLSWPRHVARYMLYHNFNDRFSLEAVGNLTGHAHHTTVLHSLNVVKSQLYQHTRRAIIINEISELISNGGWKEYLTKAGYYGSPEKATAAGKESKAT